jgi:hypothetical protein
MVSPPLAPALNEIVNDWLETAGWLLIVGADGTVRGFTLEVNDAAPAPTELTALMATE